MKPTLILAAICLCLPPFRALADPQTEELMRDALYAEEVSRDTGAAAKKYAEIVSQYEVRRNFAATALLRLAEIRRKEGNNAEAIALYQRLLKEFPDSQNQTGPAKDGLAALGGKLPDQQAVAGDEESMELSRIRNLEKTSPDLANSTSLLPAAVKNNQLKVAAYLLERGADPNAMGEGVYGPTTPLSMAATIGNLAMSELLIKAGAKVEGKGDHTPLFVAIDSCRLKIIELLLKHGADLNQPLSKGRTPLLNAISRGYQPAVTLLLDSGADVTRVMPEDNLSALHMAVFFSNHDLAARLLEKGTDPQLATKEKWKSDSMPYTKSPFVIRAGDTPLMVAVGRDDPRMIELLLSRIEKPDFSPLLAHAIEQKARAAAAWLLEKGADPNGTGALDMPLLIRATRQWDPELMKLLLDKGADPNVMFTGRMVPGGVPVVQTQNYPLGTYSPLRIAAGANISESWKDAPKTEMFRLLVRAGAKPDEGWMKTLVERPESSGGPKGDTNEVRQMMAELFIIPALTEHPAVTAMIGPLYQGPAVLQSKNSDAPLDLARLLLMPESTLKLPVADPQRTDKNVPMSIVLWRKDSQGKVTKTWSGLLDQKEPFPVLQWGDVVQLTYKEPVPDGTNISFFDSLPDGLKWDLQRKISFPVSIEVEGIPVTYQMRGDRIAFDPTKRELPWVSVSRLSRIFIGEPLMMDKAVVRREGWPDIELDDATVAKFFLHPGDSVRFATKLPNGSDARKTRRSSVRIESPGLPASRVHWVENGGSPLPPPTLIEVMADLLSSRNPVPPETSPEEILRKANAAYVSFPPEIIWCQPDFSKLRIRRLTTDGKEEVIMVDLAALIASSSGAEPEEEIRRKDIPLQGGDVVEVPLKGDMEGKWDGLTPSEAAFFAKALNCRVQFLDKNGGVELREIHYSPLVFAETEAGRYPFRQPEKQDTVSSTRMFEVLWAERSAVVKLARGGVTYNGDEAGRMFLREGDQVSRVQIDFSQDPAQPAPVFSAPRPRVVAPVDGGKPSGTPAQ